MSIEKDIEEMNGYCDLGMPQAALGIARKLLLRFDINASAFASAVMTLLIQADHLKRWRRRVENAYEKLPRNAHPYVADRMLHFYVSISDWSAALAFVPPKPKSCADLLFSMWTLLQLRKTDEATKIFKRCRRRLRLDLDELDESSLCEAMACYLAQTGNWNGAAYYWSMSADFPIFAENAWEGLMKLHAYQSLLVANEAFCAVKDENFWHNESEVMLPRNTNQIRSELDKKFHRLAKHLARVIPAKERWKFGR